MRHASHEERILQTGLEAPVLGAIISGVGTLASTFMSKGNKSAPAPIIEKPAVMPTPDDDAARAAKRRSLAGLMNRSGRASTFLSDPSGDTLG